MKPTHIVVHHTGGTDKNPLQDSSHFTFEQCNLQHRTAFNFKSSLGFYVGYQYYIEKDGTLKQARKDNEEGAHTIGANKSSIGICLAGNFDATLPTEAQVATLRSLLREKCDQWNIPRRNIVPHRHFQSKSCYGHLLADDWARNLVGETQANLHGEIKKKIAELTALVDKLPT